MLKRIRKILKMFFRCIKKLDAPLANVVIKGSRNIQYAIKNYDLIQAYWAFNNFKIKGGIMEASWLQNGSDFISFETIPELEELVMDLENLFSLDNKKTAKWFSWYKFEIEELVRKVNYGRTPLEEYERCFFTKKGFNQIIKKNPYNNIEIRGEEQIIKEIYEEKKRRFVQYQLNNNIIEGIELLYVFYRYIRVINKLFHMESDKLGRGARLFTGKE
ncbi:hypothetical protein LC087_11780 [Bacillus carboniphilus]|uniref:ApeA N-terminal domain-containing protein n=1 Tax=Bacillus carboniphilus TaxID=86663 RepID=A0ABY9JT10_9BACI|nr:hypothetical protein [Bacillus carboniphilus]WLR41565.1 hypothetical protein LC087_11780 [Bacillus carboniphilus]